MLLQLSRFVTNKKLSKKDKKLQDRINAMTNLDKNTLTFKTISKALKTCQNWKKDSFLGRYLSNVFDNMKALSSNGYRYKDQYFLYFQLYIKYFGGKKAINVPNNIGFSSNTTLKKYSPVWKYGDEIIEEFLSTLP